MRAAWWFLVGVVLAFACAPWLARAETIAATSAPYTGDRPIVSWSFTSNTCAAFGSESAALSEVARNTGDGNGGSCTSNASACGGINNCFFVSNGGVVVAAKPTQPVFDATKKTVSTAAYSQANWTANSSTRVVWGNWGACPAGTVAGTSGSAYGVCTGTVVGCPASGGWTLTGGQCTRPDCVLPEVRQTDGTCSSPPCVAGTASTFTQFSGCWDIDGVDNGCDSGRFVPPSASSCDGACVVSVGRPTDCGSPSPATGPQMPISCTYDATRTGAACSVSEAGGAPTGACAPGYTLGTVNGIARCAASSSPATASSSTSSTVVNPDTSTTTTTVTVDDSNNTTTTTTKTIGPGGDPTTTSTSTAPTDPSKPKGTTEESNDDFCQVNPGHPLCKEGSVTGGLDCVAAPACDGDAVNCAVVLQTWRTRCAVETTQAEADAFAAQAAGQEAETAAFKAGTGVAVPQVSASGWLPRGGLQDVSVTVAGQTVVLPFSNGNTALQLMGWIVLAFAWYAAARIVGAF